VFTVVLLLVEAGGAYLLWHWLSQTTTLVAVKQPTMALALFSVFALVLFLLGRFSATIARWKITGCCGPDELSAQQKQHQRETEKRPKPLLVV